MQRLSYDQRVYTVFGIDIGVFFKKAFLGNPKLRKPRRVFRLLTSDFRFPTSDLPLPTSDFYLPTSDLTRLSGSIAVRSATRVLIGSLSSDVFERRTSTGSEPFSLLVSLDATVFILPSVLILKETICPKICSKSRLKCAKSPFPVDVRRSKTSLLKLPNA